MICLFEYWNNATNPMGGKSTFTSFRYESDMKFPKLQQNLEKNVMGLKIHEKPKARKYHAPAKYVK